MSNETMTIEQLHKLRVLLALLSKQIPSEPAGTPGMQNRIMLVRKLAGALILTKE